MGQGTLYTFGETGTLRRTVTDMIRLTEPLEIPCVSYFGLNNQGKFAFRDFPNHEYEWFEQASRRQRTAAIEGTDTTTDTTIAVEAGQGTRFKPGDVWRNTTTGEIIWISAVSTDTLTVVRNWGGASGAAEGTGVATTDADPLEFLYSARPEGAESDASNWTTPTSYTNFSQIFHYEIRATGSELEAVSRYGMPNRYKRELMMAMGGDGGGAGRKGNAGHLMLELEETFFSGVKRERTSATDAGGMGGAKHFISTNVTDANATLLTRDMLEDAVQDCWSEGGRPRLIICNAFNKRRISSFYEGSVRTVRSENTGGFTIKTVETEFGILDIMLNRNCPSDEVYILQPDLMGWVTLRPFAVEPLYKGGDYKREQIVGEYGFVLQAEMYHARIHDLATSV